MDEGPREKVDITFSRHHNGHCTIDNMKERIDEQEVGLVQYHHFECPTLQNQRLTFLDLRFFQHMKDLIKFD